MTALRATVTWLGVGACVVYGTFAFDVGATELFALVEERPARSSPVLFVIHAFAGGIALVVGPLQLALAPPRLIRLHRILGRTYAGAAWITSAAGLGTAVAFDVGPAGTAAFALWSSLWFGTTTAALLHIRRRRIPQHRVWMVRSVALSLVFAVFSVVQPLLVGTGLPRAAAYPPAVLGSVLLVLAGSALCGALPRRRVESPAGAQAGSAFGVADAERHQAC